MNEPFLPIRAKRCRTPKRPDRWQHSKSGTFPRILVFGLLSGFGLFFLVRPFNIAEKQNQDYNRDADKSGFVVGMMRHAWCGYETHAWGKDELNPVSRTGKLGVMGGSDGFKGMGGTLIDAMSTLQLMGMNEEFERAKSWVAETLSFSKQGQQRISFFETTIRLLGGLMSAYDLSGDPMLLEMGEDLGKRLIPVFDGETSGIATNTAHLPMTSPTTGNTKVLVAELGSNLIEFGTLSARTGQEEFRTKAEMGLRFIHARNADSYLIGESIDRRTGKIHGKLTIAAPVDSYYEYLLKYWILTGKEDDHWRDRWVHSVDEALDKLQVTVTTAHGKHFTFVGERTRPDGPISETISHLGCFYPGNVALGVMSGAVVGERADKYLTFAEDMMQACMQLYNTSTGLGGESINFAGGHVKLTDTRYFQRPEVVESLFYLWRATHKDIYRAWAWSIAESIEQWCRVDGGYTGVQDVNRSDAIQYDDRQQSWFLAETLKYLFLIFEDDSKIDLAGNTQDPWVLNTEAHPVRAEVCADNASGIDGVDWVDWEYVWRWIGGHRLGMAQ